MISSGIREFCPPATTQSDTGSLIHRSICKQNAAIFEGRTDFVDRVGKHVDFALLNPHHDMTTDTRQIGELLLAETQQRAGSSKRGHDFHGRIHDAMDVIIGTIVNN